MAFRYMVLKNGWLIFNYGSGIENFPATTGVPGVEDTSDPKKEGPIPPGDYILRPEEISDVDYSKVYDKDIYDIENIFVQEVPFVHVGIYMGKRIHYWVRNSKGDWGRYRVRLHLQTLKYPDRDWKRTDFFIHGGKRPGSNGCIDVGNRDEELFALIRATNTNDGTDNILVRVTEYPNGPRF